MFHFLWTILYFAVLFYFIYICFNAAKLIRSKLGLFASVFFVLAIFAFNCNPGKSNDSDQQVVWHSNKDTGIVSRSSVTIPIDKNLLYTISIEVLYGNTVQSKAPVPLEAYPKMSGIFIGTNWKARFISIYPTGKPSRFKYQLNGLREWNILNAVVSVQGKNYTGFFDLKGSPK
jgi:hypothetical protein